jgi:hypothetical protein
MVKTPEVSDSKEKMEFSPQGFSPQKKRGFSPQPKKRFSPQKKTKVSPPLKLVKPKGKGGRPRNPNLPPAPGPYWYWGEYSNGYKLEKRKPYQYIGSVTTEDWLRLKGKYNDEKTLAIIRAGFKAKRLRLARGAENRTADIR